MSTLAAAILELEPEDKFPHSQMYMHGFNDALFLAAKLVESREMSPVDLMTMISDAEFERDLESAFKEHPEPLYNKLYALMEPYRKG